jgi:5'-methylthioadenosine phosphorylase
MAEPTRLGVIGGSGIYEIDALEDVREARLTTPFGDPSDAIVLGRLGEAHLAFLPRHGRGHVRAPHEINYRANLHALRQVGVTRLLSISAVGSMREEIRPGDFVIPDQFIDRTHGRASTFFEDGVVAHVSFADPTCAPLAGQVEAAARSIGVTVHPGGTYLCINGPQFSTRAESRLYRSFGVDVIGMTNVTEAKLAREAELCFATLALATDYDCWRDHDTVDVGAVLETLHANVAHARQLVAALVAALPPDDPECRCRQALSGAVLTADGAATPEARARLALLLARCSR